MARIVHTDPSRTLKEFRLLPGLTTQESTIEEVSLATPLVYTPEGSPQVRLDVPVVAAAMQSVSGPAMGIEMARLGGAAFIFCSQAPQDQAEMVREVKTHKAGFVEPRTVNPELPISRLNDLRRDTGYSTFPVVGEDGVLLGIITRRDFDRKKHAHLTVGERMVPRERLDVGIDVTDLKEANALLIDGHQSVLPVVDREGRLRHLVFRKDIHDHLDNPHQLVDAQKRLFSVATVNTHDYRLRAPLLAEAGVDVLAIDSSDGYSHYQAEALEWLTSEFPELPVIGGNIITAAGFTYLAERGAAALKVGMGSGSICITQEQKGTGRGLASAIMDVCRARDRYRDETGRYIPILADGGITNSKDVVIALALGADYVMMGRFFARMKESPTETVQINNRLMKPYWGEGSARAREWKSARYHQSSFVEGVEGFVEYAGKLEDNLRHVVQKIKASMSSCGCATISQLHDRAELELVSALSIREGKVHGIEQLTLGDER